jgi:tetratricopeptide (TPR) repeat protein
MTINKTLLIGIITVGIVGSTIGAYFGLQKKQTSEPPTISRRSGETSPSSEFLNAQRSVDYYREQIRLKPDVAKNYIELAQLFMQEARVTGNHHEYIPKARVLLESALRLAPNDVNALLTQATLFMTLHQFNNARALAERCVVMNPYSPAAYGVLCDALTELGEYDRAVEAADKMTATRPDLRSYSRVSYLRELHGDLDGAIEAMRLAADAGVRGQENRAWVLQNLGVLLLQKNATADAERIFRGILEERPNYPYALSGLARIKAMTGDPFKAVDLLLTALHTTPEHAFMEQIADVYLAMGETKTAQEMENKALEAFRQHEQEGWNINREYAAFCLNHNIHLPEALQRSEADYKERPQNIDALDTYAYALHKNGRTPEAVQIVEQMLRLKSINPVLLYHAGIILRAAGDMERSTELIHKAAAHNLKAYTAYLNSQTTAL